MAKKGKKKTSSDAPIESQRPARASTGETFPSRKLEALGVGMLLLALGLCFALFSFDPTDRAGTGNLVGPVGSAFARLILGGIGVVGYLAGLVALGLAGATLLGRLRVPSVLSLLSGLGIMAGATVLAHLVAGGSEILGQPAGGAIGAILGEAARRVIGPAGAALSAVAMVMFGVIGISDLSFSAALADGLGFLKLSVMSAAGRARMAREAHKLEKAREEELYEAARAQRAQAKLEQEAKEQALKLELEEKARLAALKATARAEEKALKRIAGLEVKERLQKEREEKERLQLEEAARAAEEAARSAALMPEPTQDAAEVLDALAVAPPPATKGAAEKSLPDVRLPGPAAFDDESMPALDRSIAEDEADEGDAVDGAADAADEADEEETEDPATVIAALGGDSERPEISDRPAAQGSAPEPDTQPDGHGPLIHERKVVEAHFEEEAVQPALPLEEEKVVYQLPPLNLLDYEGEAPLPVDGELLRAKATRLEEKLKTYGVEGKITAIRPGPVVTTYEYQPAPGVKVAKIASLSDDIAMSMEAVRVRIVAPIPGRGVVGIELPNDKRENVYLKEVIAHDTFKKSKSLLTMALGKDAEGDVQCRDLRKMPHLLIAGTTGSGKSVSINTMILSILYKATPDQVKFIMVDPKMLELSLYEDIPHLLLPVVTDPRKASLALQWAVDEMERRYQMLSDMKVRDLEGFNKRLERLKDHRKKQGQLARLQAAAQEEQEVGVEEGVQVSEPPEAVEEHGRIHDPWPGQELPEALPYIVVLIDEFADLMCVAPRDVEMSVQRLAQKARAAGIHVLLATQRPSTDVITGVIKNNFPSRLSFRVSSRHDSSTVLNSPGAENLLGMGDSLFLSVAAPTAERIHGGYVSEDEVERVVEFWKKQAKPKYDPTILQRRDDDEEGEGGIDPEEMDEHYDMAVKIVTETKKCSISAIQRRLRVGYNRAARMVEMMEIQGIVGPAMGPKGEREVLVQAMGQDGPPRS